jgi:hypothetical protein
VSCSKDRAVHASVYSTTCWRAPPRRAC